MTGKRHYLGYAALSAALVAALAGCGSGDAASGANTIAYLQPFGADPAVQSVTFGVQCAAKQHGDKVLLYDAALDQNKQINQFNTAMTQGATGIISHTVNQAAMYPSYARAHDQKVPVVDFVGADHNPPNATYVGEDPAAVAQVTVDAILKAIPSGAKAVMIGGPPSASGVTPRQDAFKVAAEKAGITILGKEDSLTLTPDDIQKKASSLLLQYPTANVIWGITANTAAVAGQLAKQQGIPVGNGVVSVGAGATVDVADKVRDGALTIMVDTMGYEWGQAMVGLLNDAIAGKQISNPAFNYQPYTKDNISTWLDPAKRCAS
ncbi:sugar ABC transporter substrate-binding protein [Amycolatopsis sp. GM8]|uniref:sugar ABC transporter substrate-binding protein n=1 Tax=Amycolatopsis sp. GM8 TaxID=2896530 RepID=UPI001F1CF72C|nr:sugar ABC transporter substrate-binding protein [Amycolatopsis sp. GM8]